MARTKTETKAPVTDDQIARCMAAAVAQGDIVNLQLLFLSYSPLRDYSTENIESTKYAYLHPEDENDPRHQEALALARRPEVMAHVKAQLERRGPAQLPHELVLAAADNAVALGKYSFAAQAYELLRVRRHMRATFLDQADAALDENDVPRAVRGYRIATGLNYDYAAFPDPLPQTPDYPGRALILHAEYPHRPEDSVALAPPEAHLKTLLGYLLLDGEAAARLDSRPFEQRVDFAEALVRAVDPDWETFAARYRESCDLVRAFGERLQREANRQEGVPDSLEDEIEAQRDDADPKGIPAHLLGRALPDGEWWQYLKELAYRHPPAVLFVSRQAVSHDVEIIMPRYIKDAPLIARLGLRKDE